MHSTSSSKYKLMNNKPGTSNSSFPKENKSSKRIKLLSAVNESSSGEDTQLVQGPGKPTSNTFSDYESGDDDVEKTSCSLVCFSTGKSREATKEPTTDYVPCIPPKIQFEDSSSGDSDESCIRLTSKRGSLRALSDYETGDSIDQDKEALISRINQGSNCLYNPSLQIDNLDLSSEDDSVCKVAINKYKNSLNLFSTSSSSDSDAPVREQRFRKRKRINSSSEEENVNVSQSHGRGRTIQNNIQNNNGGIEYLDNRAQTSRQLRPRINNQMRYTEAESSSSADEILGRIRRRDNTEIKNDSSSFIELTSSISRETSESSNSSDSNEEDVMGSLRFNRIVHSATNNVTNTESIPQNSRRQTITFIRQFRRRNNRLQTVRTSSVETESETSNDEIHSINRTTRFSRFDSELRPRPTHVDSSDSESILLFVPRRVRRRIVRLRYSDSDSNSEQTLPDIVNISRTSNSVVLPNALISSTMKNENSSDSDADSEKCPICFSRFGSKEVASPVSCDHSFCTKCIQEWAKSNNTCPIDRKLFNKIMVRPSFNGEVINEIHVESPSFERRFWSDLIGDNEITPLNIISSDTSSEEEEWEERCCVCFLRNNSHNLIVCDFCLDAYHLNCITPPLRSLPVSDWFCPPCRELVVV